MTGVHKKKQNKKSNFLCLIHFQVCHFLKFPVLFAQSKHDNDDDYVFFMKPKSLTCAQCAFIIIIAAIVWWALNKLYKNLNLIFSEN